MSTAITTALVAFIVGWWMQRNIRRNREKFPREYRVTPEMEARLIRLRKVDSLTVVLCVVVAVAFMLFFANHVGAIKDQHISSLPGTVLFLPSRDHLHGLGFLIGVCTVVLLDFVGWRVLLGKEGFVLWCNYGQMVTGFPVVSVLVIAWTIAAACCPIATFLGWDYYLRVTDEEFVQNGFWSVGEESKPLSDVVSITETSFEFEGESRPNIQIDFRDGSVWRSQGRVRTVNKPYCIATQEIAAHVSRRSGVPIR